MDLVPCRLHRSLWRQRRSSPPLRPSNASSCLPLHYPRSSPTSPTSLPAPSWLRLQEEGTWATQSCQHNTSHRSVVLGSFFIHRSLIFMCFYLFSVMFSASLQLQQPPFVTLSSSPSFPASTGVQTQARLPLNGWGGTRRLFLTTIIYPQFETEKTFALRLTFGLRSHEFIWLETRWLTWRLLFQLRCFVSISLLKQSKYQTFTIWSLWPNKYQISVGIWKK